MHLILCLDQQNGVLFNNRRQSSDRYLRDDLVSYTAKGILWMDTYSAGQFSEPAANIRICDAYAGTAAKDAFCFAERGDIRALLMKAKTLTVYRWDKIYPADSKLNGDDFAPFFLSESKAFTGYSHDLITREVYIRER